MTEDSVLRILVIKENFEAEISFKIEALVFWDYLLSYEVALVKGAQWQNIGVLGLIEESWGENKDYHNVSKTPKDFFPLTPAAYMKQEDDQKSFSMKTGA